MPLQNRENMLEKIVEIKDVAIRVHRREWADFKGEVHMPRVPSLEHVKGMEEFSNVLETYILHMALVKEAVQNIDYEDIRGNDYYNELPLYEAEPFVTKLQELLSSWSGPYYVSTYDLNDLVDVPFASEEEAKEFAGKVAPATVFKQVEGKMLEVSHY